MKIEWSDLPYFLAVARNGSTSGAARELGINQTTCARRIAAFEQALEVRLFARTASGYELTPVGRALQAHAEEVERAMLAFERATTGELAVERKLIRFTTSDWMAEHIAKKAIAEFGSLHPDVSISIDITDAHVDLTGGAADVALRGGFALEEPTLVARKVGDTPWSFYCGRKFAESNALPRSMDDALKCRLALLSGAAESAMKSLNPEIEIDVAYSANGILPLAEAIAAGAYVGPLPDLVGDSRADLLRCCAVDYQTPSLWLVYPERLRPVPHVRDFVRHLADSFARILR